MPINANNDPHNFEVDWLNVRRSKKKMLMGTGGDNERLLVCRGESLYYVRKEAVVWERQRLYSHNNLSNIAITQFFRRSNLAIEYGKITMPVGGNPRCRLG